MLHGDNTPFTLLEPEVSQKAPTNTAPTNRNANQTKSRSVCVDGGRAGTKRVGARKGEARPRARPHTMDWISIRNGKGKQKRERVVLAEKTL
jgi:hypothetical protein